MNNCISTFSTMKQILSWNVNGIRAAAKKGFGEWLHETDPDILCVQETKAHPDQLDEALTAPPGWRVWKRRWPAGWSRPPSGSPSWPPATA